ncbi:MAG: S41 family peptidase [Chlamydiae bacterium]|nr:S41 family peptidase [Chlamydiota bacterium]
MKKILFFLFIQFQFFLFLSAQNLKKSDVRSVMEEMFSIHIEHKELTPTLVKRSFKIYLDQFDTSKIYLLEKEVSTHLHITEENAKGVTNKFGRDDLSDYLAITKLLQFAIERQKSWRQEIERELLLQPESVEMASGESYLNFAESEEELKRRIKKQLTHLLWEEKRVHHLENWTIQDRVKVFDLWERRFQKREQTYLILDENREYLEKEKSEHFLAVHILKALARSLDAHTAFFSAEEAEEMRTGLQKQFQGVGVILREGIDGVVVVDLIKGGPAEKCGKIQIGDLLFQIDGQSLAGDSYEEVLSKMKGNAKSEIILGFKRKGSEVFQIHLKREKIPLEKERLHTSYEHCGKGIIGKLILPSFYESGDLSSAERDIREAMQSLKNLGELKGLVLDLRENSGGFLNQAVKVAGLFIAQGVVVISKYAKGEIKYLRNIDGKIHFNGPLLILTSKASASAAEIVAQALQDYGAALIVGDERTYGKGTIQYQTITNEKARAFYKVTVGKYYTVSGKSTQIEGVKADIIVPTKFAPYNIGEKYLEYSLGNDHVQAAFVDPLSDINPIDKFWFSKNYMPNLMQPRSDWQKMVPALTQNSGFRLEKDKNFTLFREYIKARESGQLIPPSKSKKDWGIEDLQMAEAVQILKDMILLQTTSK